jgi:hypothetical protein
MPVETEFLRATEDIQELERRVRQMDSRTYQQWIADPNNRIALERMYAKA